MKAMKKIEHKTKERCTLVGLFFCFSFCLLNLHTNKRNKNKACTELKLHDTLVKSAKMRKSGKLKFIFVHGK